MHELSITESILRTCLAEARRQNALRIRIIRLRLGPFSGIVPECIQMYLELLAEGTIAEGARIEAVTAPLQVRCRDCGRESRITRRHIACPHCGSLRLQILSANEFMIESMEVDTDGNQSASPGHGME
ncbi:MAG: hydrogenase maturation nickel metallochaperone HypA [Eubacteriales bacterium]|nr:hydrogenase maturation nickel metallochaperone HypA [Eubacteriales bacterium]